MAAAAPVARGYRARPCPECSTVFTAVHPRQLFCSPAHKRAFHNRATVRGAALAPLAMAERMTRGGSRGDIAGGREARRDAAQLLDRWVREDRAAGRMAAVDYIRARRAIGY